MAEDQSSVQASINRLTAGNGTLEDARRFAEALHASPGVTVTATQGSIAAGGDFKAENVNLGGTMTVIQATGETAKELYRIFEAVQKHKDDLPAALREVDAIHKATTHIQLSVYAVIVLVIIVLSGVGLLVYKQVIEPHPTPTPIVIHFPTQAPTPEPTPEAMYGDFNVAVAQFGTLASETGVDPTESEAAKYAFVDVTSGLKKAANTLSNDLASVTYKDDDLPIISGASEDERGRNAAALGEQIHADVLIYGYLESPTGHFALRLYISPRLHEGAEELTGDMTFDNGVGDAANLASESAKRIKFQKELTPRLNALIDFLYGLAYLKAERPTDALDWFQKSDTEPDAWTRRSGYVREKQILYLWIGTAFQELLDEHETYPCWINAEPNSPPLECASTAYQQTLNDDPQFARAYIGLGNVALAQADNDVTRGYQFDCSVYGNASADYQQALDAIQQAISAATKTPEAIQQAEAQSQHISLKALYNIGFAYASALRDQDDQHGCIHTYTDAEKQQYYDEAIRNLNEAIQTYNAVSDPGVIYQQIGAKASYQLGLVLGVDTQPQDAINAFNEVIQIAGAYPDDSSWRALLQSARNQRGHAYVTLAKNGSAEGWDSALADFNAVIATFTADISRTVPNAVVSDAYLMVGTIYEDRNQRDTAVDDFSNAATLAPENSLIQQQANAGLQRLTASTEPAATEPAATEPAS